MPSSQPLRFALIGCGKITKKHVHAVRSVADTELVAVCDIDADRARQAGEEYGVAHYQDHRRMLEEHDVDVVTVLTPSGDHCQCILDLVRYRKHIIVEKPMTLRLEDADAIIQACDAAGVRLFVVKQNRYNLPIRALRRALDKGRFGKLVLGTIRVRWCRPASYYQESAWRGTWAYDGGVLTNQASHHLDMLEWMMGEIESVTAMITTRLAPIEAEDTGVAIMRFHNGALGVVEATSATRPKDLEGSISILGEKGSVVIGGFSMDRLVTWQFADADPDDDEALSRYRENPSEFAWNHVEYIRDVVHSIRTQTKALVDGLEGRKALELINAIYESAETAQEVSLRFRPRRCKLGIVSHG